MIPPCRSYGKRCLKKCNGDVLTWTVLHWLHLCSILYQRGIYPPEMFKRGNKYGLPLLMATDATLRKYLDQVLAKLKGAYPLRARGKGGGYAMVARGISVMVNILSAGGWQAGCWTEWSRRLYWWSLAWTRRLFWSAGHSM